MSKNQIACCPNCAGRIPFKKFVELNNFSATNCGICKVRIEISNRTANGVIAGISGIISAASIVLSAGIAQTIGSKVNMTDAAGKTYDGIITEIKDGKYKVKYDG